jgi:peptidyl-prolyl cis-trans isomerase C
LYGEIKDYEQAGQNLKKALEIDPNVAAIHTNLGIIYFKQGLEKNAEMEFQRARETEPNSTEVYQNMAVYYYEKQDYQNALNQWQELTKIDPDYPSLKKNIGLAKKKLEEVDQVVDREEYNLSDLSESQTYIDKAKAKTTKLSPQVVSVRHILIAAPPKMDDQTRQQRKTKAEEIRAQLLKGANFAEMAARYSDCPSKTKGGSLGMFRRGKMVKPFEDAAFSQRVGEIGPVIETVYGYHIVQVMDRLAEVD